MVSITKLTKDLNIVQSLPDKPKAEEGYPPELIKGKFDEAANEIKTYINDTLTKEIDDNLATKEELNGVIVGDIPENSLPLSVIKQTDLESLPRKQDLAVIITNGVIANALNELKITENDTPDKNVKMHTGKVNLDATVYSYDTETILAIEPSDTIDVTNEPHTTDGSGVLTANYFPITQQADVTITKTADGSPVNITAFDADTGQITTDALSTAVQVNYKSYSKRIDVIYVDTDGTLKVLKGTPVLPAFSPSVPTLPADTFGLAEVTLSANYSVINDFNIKEYKVYTGFDYVLENIDEFSKDLDNITKLQSEYGFGGAIFVNTADSSNGLVLVDSNTIGSTSVSTTYSIYEDRGIGEYLDSTLTSDIEYISKVLVSCYNSGYQSPMRLTLYDRTDGVVLEGSEMYKVYANNDVLVYEYEKPIKFTKGHELEIRFDLDNKGNSGNYMRIRYNTGNTVSGAHRIYTSDLWANNVYEVTTSDIGFNLTYMTETATSGSAIKFLTPDNLEKWDELRVTAHDLNDNNSASIEVEDITGVTDLIPITPLSNGENKIDLSSIDAKQYPTIKIVLRENKNASTDATPKLTDLVTTWLESVESDKDVLLDTVLSSAGGTAEIVQDIKYDIYEKIKIFGNNMRSTETGAYLYMQLNNKNILGATTNSGTTTIAVSTSSILTVCNLLDINDWNGADFYVEIDVESKTGHCFYGDVTNAVGYFTNFYLRSASQPTNIRLYPSSALIHEGSRIKIVGVKKVG